MEASCKKQLSIAAARIRMDVIEGTFHAKSGHPGGSLSIADTLAYLYFKEMKRILIKSKNGRKCLNQ